MTPALDPPNTVWLIDVQSGALTPLYEQDAFVHARFDGSGEHVLLDTSGERLTYDLDGSLVSEETTLRCVRDEDATIIGGRRREDVRCGFISPSGRWMLFGMLTSEAGRESDRWIFDFDSGASRLLVEGLLNGGGCDGGFGASFSADEDFVAFAESGGDRLFVANVASGEVTTLTSSWAEWSPTGARLLVPDGDGVVLHDFEAGTAADVNGATWPAAFDPTGELIYYPAYKYLPMERDSTTVLDATRFTVILEVVGTPSGHLLWSDRPPIGTSKTGVVLALESAPDCPEGGAAVSPDGASVAAAIRMGGQFQDKRYGDPHKIVVFDAVTAELRTLGTGAHSFDEPLIRWNAEGTHILVVWPFAFGLSPLPRRDERLPTFAAGRSTLVVFEARSVVVDGAAFGVLQSVPAVLSA